MRPKGTVTRQKRITLRDIARAAGVSIPVVGAILNGGRGNNSRAGKETIARVRKIASRLHYRPNLAARQLRGRRTRIFGLLVVSAGDPQRGLLVQHLDVEAVKIGCHTLIGNTVSVGAVGPEEFDYYVREFADRGVDGVFCAVHNWAPGDRRTLVATHPNTVFYDVPSLRAATFVAPDGAAASALSIQHLAGRGRRKIGMAMMDYAWSNYRERVDGFLAAMADCGRSEDRGMVHFGDWRRLAPEMAQGLPRNLEYLYVASDQVIDDLVLNKGADAIMAHDDYWAAILIKCLRRRGIAVPDQVAVMGYMNHILADWTEPPLTTIDLEQQQVARTMVALLERMVTEGPLPAAERACRVMPKLIVRESA